MSFANRLILKIKRSKSPPFRFAKAVLRNLQDPTLRPLPATLRPVLRIFYEVHFLVIVVFRSLMTICYRNPLFQGRCASFGRRVKMDGLPFVSGHVEIHVGDDVVFGGNVTIVSGAVFDQPKLIMKDRSEVGWNTVISINSEIILEEDVRVSYDCRISDSDGHPRQSDRRAANEPPDQKDVRPVRICRHAWIGNGSHIMKGVTIGEGAIVGANSVVIGDVPAYSLVLGNPAEILFRNFGLPSTARRNKKDKLNEPSIPHPQPESFP